MKPAATARSNPCETFTATGKRLDFLRPRPDAIDRESIAHHLSMLNRWTGNTHFAYSVAQHSLLVAELIPVPEWRIYGLLHDAAEAYTGDLPTPLKHFITLSGMDFFTLERRILNVVYTHFNIAAPSRAVCDAVDWADELALATEYRDVVKGAHPAWSPSAKPHSRVIKFVPGVEAQCRFLEALDTYLGIYGSVAAAGVPGTGAKRPTAAMKNMAGVPGTGAKRPTAARKKIPVVPGSPSARDQKTRPTAAMKNMAGVPGKQAKPATAARKNEPEAN